MPMKLLGLLMCCSSLFASSIATAECAVNEVLAVQSHPSAAQCSGSDYPAWDAAYANGMVSPGLLAGDVSAWSFDNAIATVSEYYTESFAQTTVVTWDIAISLDGPWAYVVLDLGPLSEGYEKYAAQGTGDWRITQTLPAGDYTFGASAYVSDEGYASFYAEDSALPTLISEPGTVGLVAIALGFHIIAAAVSFGVALSRERRERAGGSGHD